MRPDKILLILIRGYDSSAFPDPCSEGDNLDQGIDNLLIGIEYTGCSSLETRIYRENCSTNSGNGQMLQDILDAIKNEGVRKLAFMGYSRGGGSIFDVTSRLAGPALLDPHHPNNDPSFPGFNIVFTAYIDAIRTAPYVTDAESRRPPHSQHHSNLYQQITTMSGLNLNGGPTLGSTAPNANINALSCVQNQDHFLIDDCIVTHDILRNRLYWVLNSAPLIQPLEAHCPGSSIRCDE